MSGGRGRRPGNEASRPGATPTPGKPAPPLSTTARAILAEFAAAFPESAHFRGGRRLRKAEWEKTFPEIERDVESKEGFLDAVVELCRIGVVSVKWRRFRDGTEVEALYLEEPERLFELLDRRSPESLRREMLEVLGGDDWGPPGDQGASDCTHRSFADTSAAGPGLLAAIREHLRAVLKASHPIALDDPSELADLARLLRMAPDEAVLPIRALSVRLYGDSKRLERLLPVADRISRRAAGVAVSQELGLARSYPEVSLALLGTLVFRGPGSPASPRRWECAGDVVTLPARTLASLTTVETAAAARGAAALSVENKESFYALAARLRDGRLPPRIRAVAYCGGHPHRCYIDLLSIFSSSGLALVHFGDLDPDGLFILKELSDALPVPVEPWLMDVATYRRYLRYGYDPPDTRMELLAASIGTLPQSVTALAAEIVRRRKGVEQEVVDLDG